MGLSAPGERAAIITGGGRGLGRTIAERLAQDFNVLIIGRTEADLWSTADGITATGCAAQYLVGDVSRSETATLAVDKIRQLNWKAAALVCNAGAAKSRALHEITDLDWQGFFDTNVHGCFYFSRAFLPLFVESKAGVLCYISSVAGVRGFAYDAAYVATKHAVVGLAKSVALEYGKHGVASVVICPNFIAGGMTDRTIRGLSQRRGIPFDEAQAIIAKTNPQRRIISAAEVAELVTFVCENRVPSLAGGPIMLGGEC
jgi:NAD(P)-dependent dehydrogenase (short-subunit alcohol dehydrogenase family)